MIKKEEGKIKGISRREFLKDAGLLVGGAAISSTVMMAACGDGEETTKIEIPKSGYISWNPDECAACSRCLMVCAAYHEGAVATQLSAIKWQENDYLYGFRYRRPLFCQQCSYPECYFACPYDAIVIDSATGIRYIDKEKCTGCGICVEACPFEVPRINIDTENMVAIKCDLCKDRPGGPACIEVCDRQALTLVPAEGRL